MSPPATKPVKAVHRSDVATVRHWVNHPDERATIVLPDLTAPRQGQCYTKAVATYQAVVAQLAPPPTPDPAPRNPTGGRKPGRAPPSPLDESRIETPPPPLETTLLRRRRARRRRWT